MVSSAASVVEAHRWSDGRPRNSGEFMKIAHKIQAQGKPYLGKYNLVRNNVRLMKIISSSYNSLLHLPFLSTVIKGCICIICICMYSEIKKMSRTEIILGEIKCEVSTMHILSPLSSQHLLGSL